MQLNVHHTLKYPLYSEDLPSTSVGARYLLEDINTSAKPRSVHHSPPTRV